MPRRKPITLQDNSLTENRFWFLVSGWGRSVRSRSAAARVGTMATRDKSSLVAAARLRLSFPFGAGAVSDWNCDGGIISGHSLTLGMLPWKGGDADQRNSACSACWESFVCVTAVTGFIRWLFPLWALMALFLMLRGYLFIELHVFERWRISVRGVVDDCGIRCVCRQLEFVWPPARAPLNAGVLRTPALPCIGGGKCAYLVLESESHTDGSAGSFYG